MLEALLFGIAKYRRKLSPLARLLFPAVDDNLLTYQFQGNMKIQPEWYCPILPMVLVNGCEGIGRVLHQLAQLKKVCRWLSKVLHLCGCDEMW